MGSSKSMVTPEDIRAQNVWSSQRGGGRERWLRSQNHTKMGLRALAPDRRNSRRLGAGQAEVAKKVQSSSARARPLAMAVELRDSQRDGRGLNTGLQGSALLSGRKSKR